MKYDVDKICFGQVFYNLGNDGVYFSSPQAFQKVIMGDEVKYMNLSGNKVYSRYCAESGKTSGINEGASLASVIGNPSKKSVSKQMIRLYLLKYIVLTNKNRKRYVDDIDIDVRSK